MATNLIRETKTAGAVERISLIDIEFCCLKIPYFVKIKYYKKE